MYVARITTTRHRAACCSDFEGDDMLNQPTIEKLNAMKLHGMADGFREQMETADASQPAQL